MPSGSDFTDAEIDIIRQTLVERYQQQVEIHLADSDILLHPDDPQTTSCPTVFWHQRQANFVLLKLGRFRYRTQFFYTPHEQYGTGIDEYHDLLECVAAVLQVQADHERESRGVVSGSTGATLSGE